MEHKETCCGCGCTNEEHVHEHSHEHTHGDVTHTHAHDHAHSHEGGDHQHGHGEGELADHDHSHGCGSCGACAPGDPMQETLALMQYMVNHNTAHAHELSELGKKLESLGKHDAAEQVLTAVSEFEKGNLRLSAILASLK